MINDRFFDEVQQGTWLVQGHEVKLPLFYRDGSAMMATFPARIGALKALLPDRCFTPARLAPGVGMLAIIAFEYRDTDIGAYNELGLGVILDGSPKGFSVPVVPLLSGVAQRRLDAFVWHLPVTTHAAYVAGREFWNFPKFIASIGFTDSGEQRACQLTEGDRHVLALSASRVRAAFNLQFQLMAHMWQDGQPQGGRFEIRASQVGVSLRRGAASVKLFDDHPISRDLDRILVSRRSIFYAYLPQMESILFGPNRVSLPLIQRAHSWASASTEEPVEARSFASRGVDGYGANHG